MEMSDFWSVKMPAQVKKRHYVWVWIGVQNKPWHGKWESIFVNIQKLTLAKMQD